MTTSNGFINFDDDSLKPQAVHFQYGGRRYVCREASHAAAVEYVDANQACHRFEYDGEGNGRLVEIKDLGQNQSLLLSRCVFATPENGDTEEPVAREVIQGWPNYVVGPLFDWVREHSDLGDETAESLQRKIERFSQKLARLRRAKGDLAKNAPPATTGTSA